MDAQKVLEHQYITTETLYKTYIREANDVVKLPTRQMSPRKTQKLSGGSRMFRGASALEGEVTDTAEFDTVTDEIRRWSSLSADEYQRFVEDGVLNEFEMMWQLRALFPLHLRCENRPANRPASRETGLEMPCCPASDLLWVQITQSYPNRLRFSSLPCPQSPCHALIFPVFKEGFF